MDQVTLKGHNERTRIALLHRLHQIKEQALDGWLNSPTTSGICSLLDKSDVEFPRALRRGLFESWPKFSGCHAYPVPAPKNLAEVIKKQRPSGYDYIIDRLNEGFYSEAHELAEVAYDYARLWTGEALVLRVELLQHMIDELQASLR